MPWLTTWRDKVNVDAFHKAIQYPLEKLRKSNLAMKEQQYEMLKAVVMMKRDVLAVLPTGFGKFSAKYQSLGFIFDFLRSDSDSQHAAIVVISPLNALMQDQVEKLMAFMNVCIMSSDLRKSDNRKYVCSLRMSSLVNRGANHHSSEI